VSAARFDLEAFAAECLRRLAEPRAVAAVDDLCRETVADPAAVTAGLGEPTEAAISTLYRSPELTVLNVVWAPGMSIYPHDHNLWAVIALYGGREDNAFYRRREGGLEQVAAESAETGGTLRLGEKVIHAVTNPLGRLTGAIHVYGGDLDAVPRSEFDLDPFEERPYDAERTRRLFAEANRPGPDRRA